MKKILLSAAAIMAAFAPAAAQDAETPYILSEVEANTYAVTMTQEQIAAAFPADWVSAAWGIGVAMPANTVMFENDNLTISAAVDNTPVYTANNKLSDIKKMFPTYTGYINVGSGTLPQNGWTGDEQIQDVTAEAVGNHGSIIVTTKKAGVLKFGVFAGDNSRSIGIYRLATEEEMNNDDFGGWVSYNNFRNDGENGTEKNAPAYVEGNVVAGRQYLLIAGANKNVNMHQISFVPDGGSSSISNAQTEGGKTVVAYYSVNGTRLQAPAKGVNIVKYSDGTAVKVVK